MNEEKLAANRFNRGCSYLKMSGSVLWPISNFLSNEAQVLSFDKEKRRPSDLEGFVYFRDSYEQELKACFTDLALAVRNMVPKLKGELFDDESYVFSQRQAHLAMMLGIRQRREVKKDDLIYRFEERFYFVEDNLSKDDGYSLVRKSLYNIYGSVLETLEGNNGVSIDLWDVTRKVDKQLLTGLVVYLRADDILKDFEDRLKREDYRVKF